MTMNELYELEKDVLSTSRCYADSTAFQKALAYIKNADKDLYKTLLEIEGAECGCIE